MTPLELARRLDVACAVAREAGAVMKARAGGAGAGAVAFSMKGHQDYLTEVDGEVEALVRARLASAFPQDGFIGEEGGGEASDKAWVIDPIDGTANFARGIGHFCVSIGYVAEGASRVGVIYEPSRDELFAAATGLGATLNGAPIRVSAVSDIRQSSVECGWSMRRPIGDWVALVDRVSATGAGIYRSGSGALGLAYVAAGRLEAYCELHINAWDVAAGLVLVTEAGGRTNDFYAGGGLQAGNPVLATNGALAEAIATVTGIALATA
ncbi:MAG: inositol monophosphatase family protein [Alsobacter sp.]